MKRRISVVLAVLLLAGCGGTATTPEPLPVKHLPTGVQPTDARWEMVNVSATMRSGCPARLIRLSAMRELDALVLDKTDQPVTDATVSFDIDMTNMSHGKNVIKTTAAGDGHYAGEVHFMMGGPWRVIVVVERPNQAAVNVRFNFNVK